MVIGLDESNIIDHLHNFNKKCIYQSKHSTIHCRERNFFFFLILLILLLLRHLSEVEIIV